MPSDTLAKNDLDVLPDLDTVLPCDGIRYVHQNGDPWREPCPNPGEWTRPGHCSADAIYCTPCKEQLTRLARYSWVRCADCGSIVWPKDLNWRRL